MRFPYRILVFGAVLLGPASGGAMAQPKVVSPRVIDEPVWNYPLQAERAGVREGEARALLSISEEGELLDFLVIGCTHPAFADAVATALPKFRFAPARLRGEPTTVRMPLTFHFRQEGTITSLTPMEQWDAQFAKLAYNSGEFSSWICPQSRLDRPLVPTSTPSPAYPTELRSRRERASVTIDFFVDGAGRVRMPAANVGEHPSFTREAVAALRAWTFEPPTSNGQPVIVRVTQTFRFWPPDEERAKG